MTWRHGPSFGEVLPYSDPERIAVERWSIDEGHDALEHEWCMDVALNLLAGFDTEICWPGDGDGAEKVAVIRELIAEAGDG